MFIGIQFMKETGGTHNAWLKAGKQEASEKALQSLKLLLNV